MNSLQAKTKALFLSILPSINMNSLQNSAKAYKQLCEKIYKYTFSNNQTILVKFRPQNFCHLAGLRKLDDLREFQYENGQPVYTATNIYQKALAGDFQDYYLQTSLSYSQELKDRIDCLSNLHKLLNTETAVYGFDPSIAQIDTKMKSTIILFSDEGYNFYLLLGLAEDQTYYYPETFFLRFDDAYIKGQQIVLVTNLETLPLK